MEWYRTYEHDDLSILCTHMLSEAFERVTYHLVDNTLDR